MYVGLNRGSPCLKAKWAFRGSQPRRRQWPPTPVLLPGKSHGQRSLVGCSPWGCKESDTTEWLHFHFSLSCIGEGNGNPLQCSCLENPRDGRAWWAAIYGVSQSRTRLKWLSNLAATLGRSRGSLCKGPEAGAKKAPEALGIRKCVWNLGSQGDGKTWNWTGKLGWILSVTKNH